MAEKNFVAADSDGVVLFALTASTEMGGVSIAAQGIWHNPLQLDQYQFLIDEARQWLIDNGVTQ